jgi:hypothetical protein
MIIYFSNLEKRISLLKRNKNFRIHVEIEKIKLKLNLCHQFQDLNLLNTLCLLFFKSFLMNSISPNDEVFSHQLFTQETGFRIALGDHINQNVIKMLNEVIGHQKLVDGAT